MHWSQKVASYIPLSRASQVAPFADFLDRIGAPTERGLERHKLPPDVREKPGMLVSSRAAPLRLQAPELPVKHFIMGKSWDWQNPEPYRFIDELGQIRAELQTGELLYRRTGKE